MSNSFIKKTKKKQIKKKELKNPYRLIELGP